MSVFMELMQAVEMGLRCKVNLETKSLHIDRKAVVENGVLLGEERNLFDNEDIYYCVGHVDDYPYYWNAVERLYDNYKYSMPTKSTKVNRPYFKAEDANKITPQQMANRPHRDQAQMMLEGFILLAGINGCLEWKNPEHWFWQSTTDKDLVVLKKWVSC